MKKIIFLILGVILLASSYAQDTITESDTCYFFWPHSQILHSYDGLPMVTAGTFIWETILPSDTWIYGISVRGDFPMDSTVKVWIQDTLKDGTVLKSDTVYIDSNTVKRVFKCKTSILYSVGNMDTIDFIDNCNEVYFHRPWLMRDTFYVYIENNSQSSRLRLIVTLTTDTILQQRYSHNLWGPFTPFSPNEIGGNTYWGNEFSILVPDRTRCGRPTGLHFTSRGGTWVTLAWNGGSGDSYRITLEGPDSTVVMETTDTTIALQDLMPDSLYYVNVQSMCRYQYHDFDSTFVNPGGVRIAFRNIGSGVECLDAGLQVELRPNPASRRVEVISSSPENCIEVYDEAGRLVYKGMVSDYTTTLDVSAWPKGMYVMHIATAAGTTTKKLLVQ